VRKILLNLDSKSRPYIYTTAISPAICVAAVKSLELIKKGETKEKLFSNISYFRSCADSLKLEFEPSHSGIQPLVVGSSDKALNYSSRLFKPAFL
jgi:8-amino-7-oxononanoate synthase